MVVVFRLKNYEDECSGHFGRDFADILLWAASGKRRQLTFRVCGFPLAGAIDVNSGPNQATERQYLEHIWLIRMSLAGAIDCARLSYI